MRLPFSSPRREVHGRAAESPPQAPLPGSIRKDFLPGAKKRWFEFFIAPFAERNRSYQISFIVGLIALVEAGALYRLIPLKERVPYLADWEENTGQLVEVGRFKPLSAENVQQQQIDFHLKNWIRWVLVINSQTKTNLERAEPWVRGAAVNELRDWLEKDKPGEKQVSDPDYSRTIEKKIAVTYGQGKTLFIHVELVSRKQGVELVREKKLVQIDYDILLKDQFTEENPIGAAVIHFTVGDE